MKVGAAEKRITSPARCCQESRAEVGALASTHTFFFQSVVAGFIFFFVWGGEEMQGRGHFCGNPATAGNFK